MRHKHHIIPKHMGGDDSLENIVELSIEEHALEHKKLWEQFGKEEDFIAWKCLSGKSEEAEKQRINLAKIGFQKFLLSNNANEWKTNIRNSLIGHKQTEESKHKKSESMKKAHQEGRHRSPFNDMPKSFFQKQYNGERLAEGRRKSKKWKDSVTSEEYRLLKCISDPRSKKVIIDGVEYPSIRNASKTLHIPYSRLRKMFNGNNILTLSDI